MGSEYDKSAYLKRKDLDRVVERALEAREEKLEQTKKLGVEWDRVDFGVDADELVDSVSGSSPTFLPNEEEIAAMTASIRKSWKPRVRRERAGAMNPIPAEVARVPDVKGKSGRKEDY